MKEMLMIIMAAVLANNYVLVRFLGICPFLGVSKKLDSAMGMSVAVIFVMVLATAATWPIQHLLLDPTESATCRLPYSSWSSPRWYSSSRPS